jgi:hypothetical protein
MIPRRVSRQTTHGQRPSKGTMDQQRAPFPQQIDKPIQAFRGDIGQPCGLQLANAFGRKHDRAPLRDVNQQRTAKVTQPTLKQGIRYYMPGSRGYQSRPKTCQTDKRRIAPAKNPAARQNESAGPEQRRGQSGKKRNQRRLPCQWLFQELDEFMSSAQKRRCFHI